MSEGKFFGFILGAALGGPIGAGIGTYLGHLADSDDEKKQLKTNLLNGSWVRLEDKSIIVECPHCQNLAKHQSCGEFWECHKCKKPFAFLITQNDLNFALNNEARNHELGTVCAFYIFGALAKADGKVTDDEIECTLKIMEAFSFSEESKVKARNAFRLGRDNGVYESYANTFHSIYYGNDEVIINFIDLIIALSLADGVIDPSEQKIIEKVCVNYFGVNKESLNKILEEAKKDQRTENNHNHESNGLSALEKAYNTLGCDLNESLENIKTKYKKLCIQYHPDKIEALNLPPEFAKLATEKIKEINASYELIVKEFRLKNAA